MRKYACMCASECSCVVLCVFKCFVCVCECVCVCVCVYVCLCIYVSMCMACAVTVHIGRQAFAHVLYLCICIHFAQVKVHKLGMYLWAVYEHAHVRYVCMHMRMCCAYAHLFA